MGNKKNVSCNFPPSHMPSSALSNFGFREYVPSETSQNLLSNFNSMQTSGNPYAMNPQGSYGQNNFGQPMQQDQFMYNQQQQHQQYNPYLQNLNVPGQPCFCTPPISQNHTIPCNNSLPQNILDQIRTCVGNTAPIFILPNSQPIQNQQYPSMVPQTPASQTPVNMGYPPSAGIGYPVSVPSPIFPSPCYPFPVALPVYEPFANQNRSHREKNSGCSCCRRNGTGNSTSIGNTESTSLNFEGNEAHHCCPGCDDTVCTKSNCPSSINLQALASQFLSLQGIIPCAATRLVLRKLPGSGVTTSVEDTMQRAQKAITALNRERLIVESRNAQQVNGLINLHMAASPPQNIVPILTMLQLKVNSLKALVENLVNKSIGECQSVGAAGNTNLEPMLLAMKSDAELRELLAILRQKECEERVNLNYAPYHSQRVIAESRLSNFQNKINQVEAEMERRRAIAMPWANSPAQYYQVSSPGAGNYPAYLQETQFHCNSGFCAPCNPSQFSNAAGTGFESPSPFMVQIRNPKRLIVKPNVGSPETTYNQLSDQQNTISPDIFAVKKLGKETEECCQNSESRSPDMTENVDPSRKANDSEKATGGNKKLKIRVDDKRDLGVNKHSPGESVAFSPDVVVVHDKSREELDGNKKTEKGSKKNKKRVKKKDRRDKSPASVASGSTCESEASMSS